MHHSWVFTLVLFIVFALINGIGKHLAFRREQDALRRQWANETIEPEEVYVIGSERL